MKSRLASGDARAAEGEGAEAAGLDRARQRVAIHRAVEIQRQRQRRGDLGRPGDGVAVDRAVFQRAGTLLRGLRAGQGVSIGFQVQLAFLRVQGRIDDDISLTVHGH